MGIRLQRYLGRLDNIAPGQYFADHRKHTEGTAPTIVVCCPGCGGVDTLTRDHQPDKSGRVTPAYACPTSTCSFFEWLELESWGAMDLTTSSQPPQLYRCRCGVTSSSGNQPPPECSSCARCGTGLAVGPGGHRPAKAHDVSAMQVLMTDQGAATITRCRYCERTQAEIDRC